MNRIVGIILLLMLAAHGHANEWSMKAELHFTPGLIYNLHWDPGYNGSAFSASVLYQRKNVFLESGLEMGYNRSGFELLVPLGVGYLFFHKKRFSWSGSFLWLPGLKLNRPRPFFLMAFELSNRFCFSISKKLQVFAALGPRFSVSPGYSNQVTSYRFMDLTLAIGMKLVPTLKSKNKNQLGKSLEQKEPVAQ